MKESKEQFYHVYNINEGFETFCFTKVTISTTIKFKKLDITLHSPLRLLNLGRNKRFLCLIFTDSPILNILFFFLSFFFYDDKSFYDFTSHEKVTFYIIRIYSFIENEISKCKSFDIKVDWKVVSGTMMILSAKIILLRIE